MESKMSDSPIKDLRFIGSIDRFNVQSGKIPLLILGSHAYSVDHDDYKSHYDGDLSSEQESSSHMCDFAVKHTLDYLKKTDLFYIIENQTSRINIDMNRQSARGNDNNDLNDPLYRQTIRYICNFIAQIYKKKPIVIDLHSFSRNVKWGDNDLIILEQTKKGFKLIRILKKKFSPH